MSASLLYHISAGLLLLGSLGHTLGGMMRTALRGPGAGPEAEKVLDQMKAVRFSWRGTDGNTWYKFWLGNGLSVSALLILALTVLWTLGNASPAQVPALLPIAVAAFLSMLLLTVVGFRYFGPRIGGAFALVAVTTGWALYLSL
jgi:hypothetical protein